MLKIDIDGQPPTQADIDKEISRNKRRSLVRVGISLVVTVTGVILVMTFHPSPNPAIKMLFSVVFIAVMLISFFMLYEDFFSFSSRLETLEVYTNYERLAAIKAKDDAVARYLAVLVKQGREITKIEYTTIKEQLDNRIESKLQAAGRKEVYGK